MNIAIIGYGKMGKLIEKFALERNHKITLKIDANNISDLTQENLTKCDVAIEFSTPDSALKNIMASIEAQTPIVVGTTGSWYDQFKLVKQKVEENNTSLLYATNFSIGVNILFAINNFLAKIMDSQKNYNPEIEEIHHTEKKDSPSGTAITLAKGILTEIKTKHNWKNILINNNQESDTKSKQSDLIIKSRRQDPAPGTHTVRYTSADDYIEIKHEAFNRNGFALGAVLAAEWIIDKKGIFTMEDIIKFY